MRHEREEGGRRLDLDNLTHGAAGYAASCPPPTNIAAPNTLIFPSSSQGVFNSGNLQLPQPVPLRCMLSHDAEVKKAAEMPGTHGASDAVIASAAGGFGRDGRFSSDSEIKAPRPWWQQQGHSSGCLPLHQCNPAALEAAPTTADPASRSNASDAGNGGGAATTKISAVAAVASQPLLAKLLAGSGGGGGHAHGVPEIMRPPMPRSAVVKPQGMNFQPGDDSGCAQSFLFWRAQLATSAPPLMPSPLMPRQQRQQQPPQHQQSPQQQQQQQEKHQPQQQLQLSNLQQSFEPSQEKSAMPFLNHLAAKQVSQQQQQQQQQQLLLLQRQPQRQQQLVRVTPEISSPAVSHDHARSLGDGPSLVDYDGGASDCGPQLVFRCAGQDDGFDARKGEVRGCNNEMPPPGRPDAAQPLPVPCNSQNSPQVQLQVQPKADQRIDPAPLPGAPPPLPPQAHQQRQLHSPQHSSQEQQQDPTDPGNSAPSFKVLRCRSCGSNFNEQPGRPSGVFVRGVHAYTCSSCCLSNAKDNGFYGPPGTRSLEEACGRACAECGATEEKEWYVHWTIMGAYACASCFTRWRGPGDPCQRSIDGQAQTQQQSRERIQQDNDVIERVEEKARQLKEEGKERWMDDELGKQQKEEQKDGLQVASGTADLQECNDKSLQLEVPQGQSVAEMVSASPLSPQHLTPSSPPHSLKPRAPVLRQRLLSCPPPRAAALLAVARIAGHGGSQTAAGKAADGTGNGGGDGCGSGPSGSVKRTRHKSSTAAGSPGGKPSTHRATDDEQAPSGRQQEQHKHGMAEATDADGSVPRCACGIVYRDRPGQPNGFFARGSRTYTCYKCCLRNKKATGFYGPPGTRSLEEAGGRACEECGATQAKIWHPHKITLGVYVCSRCDGHFARRGTYSRVVDGTNGKGTKGCDPRVTSVPANSGDGDGGCKELAIRGQWLAAARRKRRTCEAPAMLVNSTTSASTTTSTTTSETSSTVITSSNTSSADEEVPPKRQRLVSSVQATGTVAGGVVTGDRGPGGAAALVDVSGSADCGKLPDGQLVRQWIQVLNDKVTALCMALIRGPGSAVDELGQLGSKLDTNIHGGSSANNGSDEAHPRSRGDPEAVERVAGGSDQDSGLRTESLRMGDLIYLWMEVHIWPRPLALMLGPVAAALALDREGPIPGMSEEQQATWDLSRSELCEGFVDIADAAMGERPREPVTDAGIRRFREVASHLAAGLAAHLVLGKATKRGATATAAAPAPGVPEPGWPAVCADVIADIDGSDDALTLTSGPLRPLLLAVAAEGLRLALRLGMGAGGPGQLVARTQSWVGPVAGDDNAGSNCRLSARTGSPLRVVAPGVSWRRRRTARTAHQRAERSKVNVSASAAAVPSTFDVVEVQLLPALTMS
ncbi:hypothetical protein Vretimale_1932 [Volvox reticuliferus]|uniref:Uncharacterized protein n=1 Tax=Volvox reticuliferus TaxID=1737510 RepID=A0A8J4CYU4_9CHLO|nr:hypothetical protein Vretifemale_17297 [Volvox reticuliferus]GIL96023.1 hypothetical protein Vretimale_1932 [Volvox reticuliferus]